MSGHRVTRREIRAWLAPMRRCFAEMRQGEVDSIRGYPVTRLRHTDGYARIDYCCAGFRALLDRLLPEIKTAPLHLVERRLTAGTPLTVAQIDAALALLRECEDALMQFSRAEIKAAVLAEQVAIELDALGIREAA